MSSSWLCVDANPVIRLVADPAAAAIHALWERRQLAGPTLIYCKVANALCRHQNLGFLGASSIQMAFRPRLRFPSFSTGSLTCMGVLWRWLAGSFCLPPTMPTVSP
jgi:hypothetical protein